MSSDVLRVLNRAKRVLKLIKFMLDQCGVVFGLKNGIDLGDCIE